PPSGGGSARPRRASPPSSSSSPRRRSPSPSSNKGRGRDRGSEAPLPPAGGKGSLGGGGVRMSVYERLGVRPVINARGMNTMAGGSIMPAPVLQAMTEAAAAFVDVGELNRRAGEHIARLLGVPAAHVTSGSAGGMLLAAAAVLAGEDPERIARLPDTTGMRDEIVIQRCTRIWYDQALRTAGARLVEVGGDETCTEREVRGAIGP